VTLGSRSVSGCESARGVNALRRTRRRHRIGVEGPPSGRYRATRAAVRDRGTSRCAHAGGHGTAGSLPAPIIVSKRTSGDTLAKLARSDPFNVEAEVELNLMPPGTYADGRVVISPSMEQACRIGGDAHEYATGGPLVHVTIFDVDGPRHRSRPQCCPGLGYLPQTPTMTVCRCQPLNQLDIPVRVSRVARTPVMKRRKSYCSIRQPLVDAPGMPAGPPEGEPVPTTPPAGTTSTGLPAPPARQAKQSSPQTAARSRPWKWRPTVSSKAADHETVGRSARRSGYGKTSAAAVDRVG